MPRKPTIDDMLPLKPVDFLVLMVLAENERHGYGIVQDIAESTRGGIRLVPGNLYSVLRRLIHLGIIQEAARRPAADLDDERRRYYAITALGTRVLKAEAERLRDLVALAESRSILDRAETAR